MGLEGLLGDRLAQIDIEREEVLIRLEGIRAKIKRVDEKRSGQQGTAQYEKWTTILRGLQHDHDKHRRIFAALEAEFREKTARLMQKRSAFTPFRDRASDSDRQDVKHDSAQLLHSAIEKSHQGDCSALTFEEVAAMLHAHESGSETVLEEKVTDAMWAVHAQCHRICAKWVDLVRHDARVGKD